MGRAEDAEVQKRAGRPSQDVRWPTESYSRSSCWHAIIRKRMGGAVVSAHGMFSDVGSYDPSALDERVSEAFSANMKQWLLEIGDGGL